MKGCARDIGVASTGKVWVIGCKKIFGGQGIYRLDGNNWVKTNGAATNISVD